VLGLAVVLFIICGSKFELKYFLTPTFAKRNHVTRQWALATTREENRFGLFGFVHRPASTERLNRLEIYHVCQRPDHHFA
jgi:hypothetical protein